MTVTLYRQYLAADALQKRLDALGVKSNHIILSQGRNHWRDRKDEQIANGETPTLYQYPEVWAELAYQHTQPHEVEANIERFQAAYPDLILATFGKVQYLYWEPLDGVGVTIQVSRSY